MTTKKSKEWALSKIKKCLALFAKGSGNEATTALRQAQALMHEYGISNEDVQLSDINEAYVDIGLGFKKPPQWRSNLAGVSARIFDCRILLSYYHHINSKGLVEKVKRVRFIGIETNAELAAYTYEVLARQLTRDRKRYLKSLHASCSLATRRRRADLFADNWVQAVIDLIIEFAQQESSLNLIDAYISQKYQETIPVVYAQKSNNKRDDSARRAGIKAGRNAQLHHAMRQHQEEQLALSFEGARS